MKVSFYVKQVSITTWKGNIQGMFPDPKTQKTRDQFLFSEDYSEMKVCDKIEFQGEKFQVDNLQWIDEKRTKLKAVCLEIKQARS